jgi:coiled-coil domain-containing protein 77
MSNFDEKFWYHKVYQISALDGLDSDKYEILNYYRALVEKGENEREEWLRKHETVRVKQDLVHRLEWELKTRKEEILELESQVKNREDALGQGRDDLLRLAKENEELINAQQSDKDKLLKLMDKTEAIHQDIFISEDQKPNTVYSYGTQNNSKGFKPKHIVRTLHLPSPQNDQISKVKQELLDKLEAQRVYYRAQIEDSRENTRKLEYLVRNEYEENSKTIEKLVESIKKAQTGKLIGVRDYFLIRHEYEIKENDLIKAHQTLREKIDSIIKHTTDTRTEDSKKRKLIQKEAQTKAADYAHEFRKQAETAKDNLDQITEQYSHLKEVFLSKSKDLEDRYKLMQQKYQELKKRKQLETQGLKTLIKTLEEKIELLENPPIKKDRTHIVPKKTCDRCTEKNS